MVTDGKHERNFEADLDVSLGSRFLRGARREQRYEKEHEGATLAILVLGGKPGCHSYLKAQVHLVYYIL